MESVDEIVFSNESDALPELIEMIQADSEHDCAGTLQHIDGSTYPCIGGGLVVTACERRVSSITHAEKEEALAGLNIRAVKSAPAGNVDVVTWVPKAVKVCPCVREERVHGYESKVLQDLGVEKIPVLRDSQAEALKEFSSARRSMYIYGGSGQGKTVLAAACAMAARSRVHVLIGDEISAEWRRKAFENQPLDYQGMLLLDDVDKTMATDPFKEKLWYILDRVSKGKLRVLMTSNLSPKLFAEKYTAGKDEAQSMISRMSKFIEVAL